MVPYICSQDTCVVELETTEIEARGSKATSAYANYFTCECKDGVTEDIPAWAYILHFFIAGLIALALIALFISILNKLNKSRAKKKNFNKEEDDMKLFIRLIYLACASVIGIFIYIYITMS